MEPEDFVTFTITPSESLDDPSWSHDWVQQWKDDEQPLLFVEVKRRKGRLSEWSERSVHFSSGGNRYIIGPFTTAELRLLAESLISAADEAELGG
jgi:hypothetical protein